MYAEQKQIARLNVQDVNLKMIATIAITKDVSITERAKTKSSGRTTMKNRSCPARVCCIDYNCNACETCATGNYILKLKRKIKRLEAKNDDLQAENDELKKRIDTLLHPDF